MLVGRIALTLHANSYLGMGSSKTRSLFWSTIIAMFVVGSMATANCDWLLIPNVARVAKVGAFDASIIDVVFDVEFTLMIVPV